MRRILACAGAALLLLAGCATVDPARMIQVQLHELDMAALVRVCNRGTRDHEPDLLGCYNYIGDVCHIYTLPRWVREDRDGDLSGYHRTLGHELDHCGRGRFHGEDRGVRIP